MNLTHAYLKAAADSGRGVLSLLMEAARLRLSPTRLGLSEYIDFQLYKTDIAWEKKRAFGGQRTQAAAEELLIDDYSRFLSLDKVTMYALLAGLNLPIPKIRAVYRSLRPNAIGSLNSADQLAEFISIPDNLPLYIKRSFGSYGRGNVLVKGYEMGFVLLGNGEREPIADFCASLDDGRTLGWILQDPLTPHRNIAALTGSNKISGLRVHTFLQSDAVKVTKAIFKVNAGVRDSDNFEHGASGNMLAALDIRSGRVIRAIAGVGLHQTQLQQHPRTQIPLVDFEIPYWREVVDLVTDAQKAFPGFICPGWDIAICDDGPKILEVNTFGDVDLSQHAYRRSFFDEEFMSCLQSRHLGDFLFSQADQHKVSKANNRKGARRRHWRW
ncbi:sugar-transfer associated ATP-grasp domain-containing protein [Inhella sp.]|uniref:sugar-transfer associated ATP-grasp domain-containing protein n=1 Tax=Inhella sp. TaxID=1921806 RepID=UPI0035B1AA15